VTFATIHIMKQAKIENTCRCEALVVEKSAFSLHKIKYQTKEKCLKNNGQKNLKNNGQKIFEK